MKTALRVLGSSLLLSLPAYAQQASYTLYFADNPPFTLAENGKEKGVAIDIVGKLFERAKLGYKFQSLPLARSMEDAKSKPLTCVFPVQRAQRNEAEYAWVSPIFVANSGLFVNKDSTVALTTLSDAKKLKIGALRGSGDAEYLKGFGFSVEEANTQDQNVKKLLGKQIDAWATDVLSAKYFVEQVDAYKGQAPRAVYTFRKSLGSLACNTKMPKADIAKLQKTVDDMIKDGSLQKLAAGS
ncbi:MAG: transporter substrate-binding domain-containing protein [Rhodocyclaceae bacterium]|nr:transporter substrate-binding domain-containing protein [Rhodocyclaceae bacterium]